MKIIWRKNPLATVVELENDLERSNFRLSIENDAYRWAAAGARFYLDGKNAPVNIQRALSDLQDVEAKTLKESVDRDYEEYLAELGGFHIGDCTCCPSSCSKCQAEGLLGINTIAGLGKHPAHNVDSLIRANPAAPVEEILGKLARPDYSVPNEHYKGKEDLWFQCAPRWAAESRRAHEWLTKYYDDHPEAR